LFAAGLMPRGPPFGNRPGLEDVLLVRGAGRMHALSLASCFWMKSRGFAPGRILGPLPLGLRKVPSRSHAWPLDSRPFFFLGPSERNLSPGSKVELGAEAKAHPSLLATFVWASDVSGQAQVFVWRDWNGNGRGPYWKRGILKLSLVTVPPFALSRRRARRDRRISTRLNRKNLHRSCASILWDEGRAQAPGSSK